MKKCISTMLVIIWCLIIFLFSNQNGNESTKQSNEITNKVIEVLKIEENKVDDVSFIIRKTAHIFLYFILGLIVYYMFKNYHIDKPFIATIIFCFIYSITDELHQYFIPNRSSQITDIILDSISSILSSYFYKRKVDHEKNK